MNKVDKRLQEAVEKGFQKKQAAERKAAQKQQAKEKEYEKELKRFLPKARAWVKDKLFALIAEEESQGHHSLTLNKSVDGIPTAIIYKLIRKIDGLSITWREEIVWEDKDYGKVIEPVYTITWKSADPNLNRND